MRTIPRYRLLFFCGATYVAGAEIHMLALMRELHRRGHRVACVVSGWNDGDFIGRLDDAKIPYFTAKLGWLYLRKPAWTLDTMRHYAGARLAIARALKSFQPDATIHTGYRSVLALPGLIDRATALVHILAPDRVSRRTRMLYRWSSSRAALFCANSEFMRKWSIEIGLAADQIVVSYPPVEAAAESEQGLEVRQGPVRVGIVGQVIPSKGHSDLFHAVASLSAEGCSLELHVYGTGPSEHVQEVHRLAYAVGITSIVHFHGFERSRARIYRNLDVVAVPTRDKEAFGLVAAEPALWGLPVVLPRAGGLVEVVVDEKTGLFYRHRDIDDLTSKLRALVESAELRHRLGAAAKDYVSEHFALASIIDRYEDTLHSLACKQRPR